MDVLTSGEGAEASQARIHGSITPPSNAPWSDRERVRLIANVLARFPYKFWNWGDSIGFEGLVRASDTLGDDLHRGIAYGMLRTWLNSARGFIEKDNTAPGHALCMLYEATGDSQLISTGVALAKYLLGGRRLPQGPRVVTERALLISPYGGGELTAAHAALLADPGPATYVDELHMTPPFLSHLGVITGRDDLLNRAAEECLSLLRLLQDEQSGLMWHFYLEKTGERYCHGWGRGQGWAMLGLLDVLRVLPDGHESRAELVERLRTLLAAVLAKQRVGGSWAAIIDDDSSGAESSTGAFVMTALLRAHSQGLMSIESIQLQLASCWCHLESRISPEGVLREVSAEVYASTLDSHYRHVPTGAVVPWGQGPLLLAIDAARRVGWGAEANARNFSSTDV